MKGILNLSNKWDIRYLELAKQLSTWSKDPSSKIGAVAIGDKGQVLSCGYNDFPKGIQHFKTIVIVDSKSSFYTA